MCAHPQVANSQANLLQAHETDRLTRPPTIGWGRPALGHAANLWKWDSLIGGSPQSLPQWLSPLSHVSARVSYTSGRTGRGRSNASEWPPWRASRRPCERSLSWRRSQAGGCGHDRARAWESARCALAKERGRAGLGGPPGCARSGPRGVAFVRTAFAARCPPPRRGVDRSGVITGRRAASCSLNFGNASLPLREK